MSSAPRGLVFLPLGGCGEIGMNLNLYGYDGRWIIVDLGVSFGDDTMPGVEMFMADPAFIEERRESLLGIVLTHGHEDHLGAVHHLWPRLRCPVYATPFAAALLRGKLAEAELLDEVELHEVPLAGRFSLGPFDLEMVTVTHSIPEPNAVAIRTPAGLVVHTGDWKLDPEPLVGATADFATLRRLGEEGVLAVVGDSTNAFVQGTAGSEAAVRQNLIELFGHYRGKIAVACFATNVARVASIALAARAAGRSVCLHGRSLWRIESVARELGYLDAPPFLADTEAAALPPDRVVHICTGSQGEARSALARVAAGTHPGLALGPGDVAVFSSRIIPGNERAIFRLHNQLARLGAEIVTDRDRFIHVSGHPAREEIARLYGLLRPRHVVPVHGEMRHLREHARLARALDGCAAIEITNGTLLRLGPGEPQVIETVPTGRLAVDGARLLPKDSTVLQERRRLSHEGSAVVTLVLDQAGRFVATPQVSTLGVIGDEPDGEGSDAAALVVRAAIDGMRPPDRLDDDAVRETARISVRRHLGHVYGKRPPTQVHLVRV